MCILVFIFSISRFQNYAFEPTYFKNKKILLFIYRTVFRTPFFNMNNAHRRKSTVAHEAAEVLLEEAEKTVLEEEKEEKLTIRQRFRDIRGMVYNPEYREFLSRGLIFLFLI
jgi:hypothetical protein